MLFFLPYLSEAQNCNQPVADYLYQQYRNQVAQPFSDAAKLDRVRVILNNNCFSSLQIKGLAEVFRDDDARLEFAQLAYARVFDPQDFYEVYNSFAYFSTVFRLHDHVLARRGGASNNPSNPNPSNPPQNTGNLNFPNLIYPSLEGYNGPNNCNFPMNTHDFTLMAQDVVRLGAETARLNRLNTVGNNYCLSTEQAMKFASLLESEENRLFFLKNSFTRIFDIANYGQAVQLFGTANYRTQFMVFINSRPNMNPSQQDTFCEVNTSDYSDIKRRLSAVSFDNEKINLAKSILRTKRCFTTDQIAGLATLFSFSSSRVDFVKFAYDYTKDVDNYYKLTDVFSFSSDKNEILEFIESKQ